MTFAQDARVIMLRSCHGVVTIIIKCILIYTLQVNIQLVITDQLVVAF